METKTAQLKDLGLESWKALHPNLSRALLVENAIKRGEGILANNGALIVGTGTRTGRSPSDRFIVEEKTTKDSIGWGKVNVPISEAIFDQLYQKVVTYLQQKELFL
ncbi:phosphoenolpyruvate carboxykinase (ATP), partial [bacterium]|nr:phosphoenolpyruvate carboxykinase (ATP) [bacterium]